MSDAVYLGGLREVVNQTGLESGGGIINHNRGFYLKTSKLYQHILIEGGVGSGKTEFLKSLIYQLIHQGKRICLVDGAGSEDFTKEVCTIAHEAGLPPTPVLTYMWGDDSMSSTFHGFIGNNHAVFNRLVALLDLSLKGSDSDFYIKKKRAVLNRICGINIEGRFGKAEIEPPRSLVEVEERSTVKWFTETYGEHVNEFVKSNKEYIEGLWYDVDERLAMLYHLLSPDGFRLGDAPLTIFSIKKLAGGDTAQYLIEFLAECFKDAMSKDRDTVWIIDELGLFEPDVAASFVKVGRQYNLGLVLALQRLGSLGISTEAGDVQDIPNTKVLMRTNNSEIMRAFAGKESVRETRTNYDDNSHLKGVSVGYRDAERITHDDVMALPDGGAYIMAGGATVKIQSKMIPPRVPFHPSMMSTKYRYTPKTKPQGPPPKSSGDNPEKTPF